MRTTLALLALSAAALAQFPVAVDGTVRRIRPLPICPQGETHALDCAPGVWLKSSVVDLSQYEGLTMRLFGNDVSVPCRTVVDVTAVQTPQGLLTWSGIAVPGCRVTFRICGPGISGWYLFVSLAAAYYPVDPGFGTILIELPAVLLGSGVHGNCTDVPVDLPLSPALIGLSPQLQGVVHAVGPIGPPFTTNPVCVPIGPGNPCR
jgi:hypothetical protein